MYKMKKQILILISLAFFLVVLNGISAAMLLNCGDGRCDTAYGEQDIRASTYCPADCGLPDRDWCDTTYPRGCPVCDISRPTDLGGWCSSNGYTPSGSCQTSQPKTTNNYLWLIFLIIGAIIGYYYKKKRK
jgi:LPXTG-motif cell wall-anchored protein